MKTKIHPNYAEATASCACGSTFKTFSTNKVIKVDICSECHPFYTGRQKFVDTAGRVEKFQKKYSWGENIDADAIEKNVKEKNKAEAEAKRIQEEQRQAELKAKRETKKETKKKKEKVPSEKTATTEAPEKKEEKKEAQS